MIGVCGGAGIEAEESMGGEDGFVDELVVGGVAKREMRGEATGGVGEGHVPTKAIVANPVAAVAMGGIEA